MIGKEIENPLKRAAFFSVEKLETENVKNKWILGSFNCKTKIKK
jgi:hypothetical protein